MAPFHIIEPKTPLKPVANKRTLTGQAYAAIKEAILTLQLKPDAPLVEDELAVQLQTSKTPVRDALLALEREGLVVRVPYKGTYVAPIREEDSREIFQLLAVLEGLAGQLATPSFSRESLVELEALLDMYDQALIAGDLAAANQIGEQFHRFIRDGAENQWLQSFLSTLDDHLQRLRIVSSHGVGRVEKSAAEHRRILAALRAGDPQQVAEAFKAHHHSVLEDLMLSEVAV